MKVILGFLLACNFVSVVSAETLLYTDFSDGQLPPTMRIEHGTATVKVGYIDWQAGSRIQFGSPEWSDYSVEMEIEFLDPGGTLYAHWYKELDGIDDSLSYQLLYHLSDVAYLNDYDGNPDRHHYNTLEVLPSPVLSIGQRYLVYFGANETEVFAGLDGVLELRVQNFLYRSGYVAIECTIPAEIHWIRVSGNGPVLSGAASFGAVKSLFR